jgi:hypothetical protein
MPDSGFRVVRLGCCAQYCWFRWTYTHRLLAPRTTADVALMLPRSPVGARQQNWAAGLFAVTGRPFRCRRGGCRRSVGGHRMPRHPVPLSSDDSAPGECRCSCRVWSYRRESPEEEVVADVYARLRRPRSFDISMRRSKKTRMRPTTIFALALILALTACSQGTGILPAGPDTYTVTKHRAPVLGGAKEAQRVAMTEANDYCVQSGRKFFPLNMAEQAAVPAGGPGYSVTFRCLQADGRQERQLPSSAPIP